VHLGILIGQVENQIAVQTLPEFGSQPKNLTIQRPRTIVNAERIFLGDDVWLGANCLLIAITRYPTAPMRHPEKEWFHQKFDSKIVIGSRVSATAGLQVAAMDNITIEDDVLFASNVNITDALHGYERADIPFKYQKMFRIAPIVVKQGCWIGQNVVILPGVTIGEQTIIGANSVVTKSLPDRCIAVGAPARVIKRWDEAAQGWVAV
jgi:acetyltransferase-like isoleucine patch superfamily enzyme